MLKSLNATTNTLFDCRSPVTCYTFFVCHFVWLVGFRYRCSQDNGDRKNANRPSTTPKWHKYPTGKLYEMDFPLIIIVRTIYLLRLLRVLFSYFVFIVDAFMHCCGPVSFCCQIPNQYFSHNFIKPFVSVYSLPIARPSLFFLNSFLGIDPRFFFSLWFHYTFNFICM